MHRTDGDANYPTGHFSEGDPTIPRLPTQVDSSWLNDVQEELVGLVLGAGLTLIKGAVQLPAVLMNLTGSQVVGGIKTFTRGIISAPTGAGSFDVGIYAKGGSAGAPGAVLEGTGDVWGATLKGGPLGGPGAKVQRGDGLTAPDKPALMVLGSMTVAEITATTTTTTAVTGNSASGVGVIGTSVDNVGGNFSSTNRAAIKLTPHVGNIDNANGTRGELYVYNPSGNNIILYIHDGATWLEVLRNY